MNTLFTIGHSTHSIEEFLSLLQSHCIQAIADVRSQPYSRRFPWFSREALEQALRSVGIRYVFLGKELGARRDERQCYVNSVVNFDLIASTPAFAEGLRRLRSGLDEFRIALLCAEKDPLDCHRTILVARHATKFTPVEHILADGTIESHEEAEKRLLRKFRLDCDDLFISEEQTLARAYTRRSLEIAYVETKPASDEP